MTSNNIIINKKIIITIAHNILPWRSLRAKRDGSSFAFTNKFPLSIVQLYIPLIELQKQICHLFTQILNLQITICWDFLNTVSHKVKQSPEEIKDPGAILACKHFNSPSHDYKAHGKFTIIEQLRSISSLSTEFLKEKIKQREHFWIKKLKTHVPYGLNQKAN